YHTLNPTTGPGLLRLRLLNNRRNPDNVTRLQPGVRLDSPLVHPHFALANHTINNASGHAPQAGHQEIIDPLASHILVNGYPLNTFLNLSSRRDARIWPGP